MICEINSRPGIRKHLWPAEGRPRDVTGPIVDMLFPPGTPSRIPIAVVTGTGSTIETARLLAHVLSGDGSTVRLAARDGVSIGGQWLHGGGLDGPSAARMLLLDPAVDAAVIELSPADVLRNGLGLRLVRRVRGDRRRRGRRAGVRRRDPCRRRRHPAVGRPGGGRRAVPSARIERGHASVSHRWKRPAVRGDGGRSALYAAALARCLGRLPEQVERGLRTYPGRP